MLNHLRAINLAPNATIGRLNNLLEASIEQEYISIILPQNCTMDYIASAIALGEILRSEWAKEHATLENNAATKQKITLFASQRPNYAHTHAMFNATDAGYWNYHYNTEIEVYNDSPEHKDIIKKSLIILIGSSTPDQCSDALKELLLSIKHERESLGLAYSIAINPKCESRHRYGGNKNGIVWSTASSIAEIIVAGREEISPTLAKILYIGLLHATEGFSSRNVKPKVFLSAARLAGCLTGIETPELIYKKYYKRLIIGAGGLCDYPKEMGKFMLWSENIGVYAEIQDCDTLESPAKNLPAEAYEVEREEIERRATTILNNNKRIALVVLVNKQRMMVFARCGGDLSSINLMEKICEAFNCETNKQVSGWFEIPNSAARAGQTFKWDCFLESEGIVKTLLEAVKVITGESESQKEIAPEPKEHYIDSKLMQPDGRWVSFGAFPEKYAKTKA